MWNLTQRGTRGCIVENVESSLLLMLVTKSQAASASAITILFLICLLLVSKLNKN